MYVILHKPRLDATCKPRQKVPQTVNSTLEFGFLFFNFRCERERERKLTKEVLIFRELGPGWGTKRSNRRVPEVTKMHVPEPSPVLLDDNGIVSWV